VSSPILLVASVSLAFNAQGMNWWRANTKLQSDVYLYREDQFPRGMSRAAAWPCTFIGFSWTWVSLFNSFTTVYSSIGSYRRPPSVSSPISVASTNYFTSASHLNRVYSDPNIWKLIAMNIQLAPNISLVKRLLRKHLTGGAVG